MEPPSPKVLKYSNFRRRNDRFRRHCQIAEITLIALALKCSMSIWGTFVPNEASKRPGTKKSRTGCPKQAPKAYSGTKKSRAACHKQALKAHRNQKVSYFLSQTSPESIQEPKHLVPFIPNEASKCPGTKKSRTGRPKQAPKALRNQKITCCLSQTSPQGTQEAQSLVLPIPTKPSRHS
jgi:hypothetical protein